jgi:transcription antitermination factor NusG
VQIESLRIVARYPSRVKREQRVIRGQRVRVIAGPCEGVEGIVTAVRGESRVVVMVDVISQSVSVMVTAGCLEEIGAAESCPAA